MKNILVVEPWIDESELEQLKRVINSTYVTEAELTKEFEELTSKYINEKYTVAVSNGTMGLFCCLKQLNLDEDDEVIVPNITFISTATAALLAGAKIRLVDVDPLTSCIDIKSLEMAINQNTKVIMPVHLYGRSCEMDEVINIAQRNNIKIIEDAAQGVGVFYKNKHVGTLGDFGVLSYYGNKTITTGEGGIVICPDLESLEDIYRLKNHGRSKKGTFIHETIGWNFSFTEMQAAIGISQMRKLNKIIDRKLNIYNTYLNKLDNNLLSMNSVPNSTTRVVHWLSNINCDDSSKLQDYLKTNGIPSRKIFFPLNMQPCFRNESRIINRNEKFDNSELALKTILSLPSSILMDDEQQNYIINVLNNYQ